MRIGILKKSVILGIVLVLVGTNMAIGVGGAGISKPAPRIIYVDDDNTEGPWLGTLEFPYQYIQDGIDAASAGDTVHVLSGTYYECVVVYKTITLEGENKDTTIIDAEEAGSVVEITSDQVYVEGFTMKNCMDDLDEAGVKILSDENTITNNNLIHHDAWGIKLRYSSYNLIDNNYMENILAYIEVYGSSHNTIQNNVLTATGGWPYLCAGMWIQEYSHYNLIQSNLIYNIHFCYGINVQSHSEHNTIDSNQIIDNPSDPQANSIQIDGGDYTTASNNEISNNYGTAIGMWFNTGCEISGNTIESISNTGIYLFCCKYDMVINNNYVSDTTTGVRIGPSCTRVVVESNELTNNYYGVSLSATSYYGEGEVPNNYVRDNEISENNYGVYINIHQNYGPADDNIIYHNVFTDNGQNAYDECSNFWDDGYPSGGNYWDDYTGEDLDGDGIGDTPYPIPGGDNYDYYPLMFSMSVYIITPTVKLYEFQTFIVHVCDTHTEDPIEGATVYYRAYDDSGNIIHEEQGITNENGNVFFTAIEVPIEDEDEQIFCEAYVEAEGYDPVSEYFIVWDTTGDVWGYVRDAITREGIPLVKVTASPGGFTTYTRIINPVGHYLLEVEPGTYDITYSKTGYLDFTIYGVTVVTEDHIHIPDVLLERDPTAVTVDGHVYDTYGNPVPHAKVEVLGEVLYVYTDPFGYYSLLLNYGEWYRLKASKPGYIPDLKEVYTDGDKTVDFILIPEIEPHTDG